MQGAVGGEADGVIVRVGRKVLLGVTYTVGVRVIVAVAVSVTVAVSVAVSTGVMDSVGVIVSVGVSANVRVKVGVGCSAPFVPGAMVAALNNCGGCASAGLHAVSSAAQLTIIQTLMKINNLINRKTITRINAL